MQFRRVTSLIHNRIDMLRLIGSKERYNANRSACESFVFQDSFDLICDCLCFKIVSVVMVPDTALYIEINQWRFNSFGGSRNPQRKNLILVEGAV